VFVACRRRGSQAAVGFVGQLPRSILDPSLLCLRGGAVVDWGEHIVRAVDHLQRLAQVVAGHRPQPRTEAAVGVSGAVYSIDANPQLGIAVQPRPRRPTDHGWPFIKTRVR
jgi:hypothetical protein